MHHHSTGDITRLLNGINGGAPNAFAELVEAVYDDLKRIAEGEMRRGFNHRPLDSLTRCRTEIVHDAVVRLMKQYSEWKNREHFFAVAARLIGQLVIDYRRYRKAGIRGSGHRGAPIDGLGSDPPAQEPGLADVDEDGPAMAALRKLSERYPRPAEVTALHALCEFPLPKVAELVGVGLRTVERDWALARAFLTRELPAAAGGTDAGAG